MGSAASVFTLYLLTVPHDLAGAGIDSAKFAYIPRLLGVPHPPGYPLYMLLGWLFSPLPVGTLAFRMNLLSALGGAATASVTTLVAVELGCAPAIAALVGTLAGAATGLRVPFEMVADEPLPSRRTAHVHPSRRFVDGYLDRGHTSGPDDARSGERTDAHVFLE